MRMSKLYDIYLREYAFFIICYWINDTGVGKLLDN